MQTDALMRRQSVQNSLRRLLTSLIALRVTQPRSVRLPRPRLGCSLAVCLGASLGSGTLDT